MSNNGVRIVIERRDGGHWHWALTANGEQHMGQRVVPTAELAAQEAEIYRNQLSLSKHFRKQREQNANPN